ncbi:MAG: hypothetical protein JXD19_04770 [Deltaproteobacteria bacterium]|nr:hypothetical protein [Deltaproteobacteria bacterium]
MRSGGPSISADCEEAWYVNAVFQVYLNEARGERALREKEVLGKIDLFIMAGKLLHDYLKTNNLLGPFAHYIYPQDKARLLIECVNRKSPGRQIYAIDLVNDSVWKEGGALDNYMEEIGCGLPFSGAEKSQGTRE